MGTTSRTSRPSTFLRHYHPGQMTTACYLVAHRPSRTLTCAAARHSPPLLRHADGAGTCLDQPLRPPLGLRSRHPIPPGRPHPGQDDTLLLYTDGLIERCREETIIVPQRLTACARTTVGLDLADLCERFLRRRTGARSESRPVVCCAYLCRALPGAGESISWAPVASPRRQPPCGRGDALVSPCVYDVQMPG
ncbi:PP2C family protein-serine/threonine phosphatase [Streptomyces sp. FBKL.4005]|uniref:PP2C family protein-serine/threonine phosphatase n=1 Tax=Streptomyces sp. FBKL.4005 TaxID=2015515 RepID=UPI0039839034